VSTLPRAGLAPALALLGLAGCAGAPPLPQSPADRGELCRAQLARVDAAVARADAGDAGAARIDGFPWLRVTRPLASFRDEVEDRERLHAWLGHLADAAAAARHHELTNLPEAVRAALADDWRAHAPGAGLPGGLERGLAVCREHLNATIAADPEARQRLRAAATVEDEYVTWQRVLGLYPLARQIARWRIERYQRERDAAFGSPAGAAERRHAVPSAGADRAATVARGVERDPLGIPQPTPVEHGRLFDAHAPVWAVATAGAADHPGALRLDLAGRPFVDPARPAEYRRLSFTRFEGEVLLQLNYMIWFPERPGEGLDLYAGHLDGLIWRVTLATDGKPLAYDSIHACGCYYTLFPARGRRAASMPASAEPVASPAPAPKAEPGERVVVRLEPGTHYLSDVATTPRPVEARGLAPLSSRRLRSLPHPVGGSASAFAPDGLVPSSARLERFVLWPFGVPSAGAMRQWGTHAIAFVGRRHFDDPYLLERLLAPE